MSKKLLSALALASLAGTAFAAAPNFADVDTDKNGSISPEEAQAVTGLNWDEADANKDGALSQEEYDAVAANLG